MNPIRHSCVGGMRANAGFEAHFTARRNGDVMMQVKSFDIGETDGGHAPTVMDFVG